MTQDSFIDVVATLKDCAVTILEGSPDGVPDIQLCGPEGVTAPYGCCHLLAVESLGSLDRSFGSTTSDGCDDCDTEYENRYRVSVHNCAPPFDASRADGAAVSTDERNALAQTMLSEWWELFTGLRCCLADFFAQRGGACSARVVGGSHSLRDGCAKYWVDIVWSHTPCC